MGKDYVKSISKEIDRFLKCKYAVPKKVETTTDRIRKNTSTYATVYTVFSIAVLGIATFFANLYAVFIAYAILAVVAFVVGELKLNIPVGDKKYRVEKSYCALVALLLTLGVAWYSDALIPSLYTFGFALLCVVVHSIFAVPKLDI